MGDSYGLQTVAAVVIGGTSMLGGEGGVIGTVPTTIALAARKKDASTEALVIVLRISRFRLRLFLFRLFRLFLFRLFHR